MSEFRSLSRRPAPEPDVPQASLRRDREGFCVQAKNGQPVRIAWEEVVEVRAYKMDLINRDLVCLSLSTGKNGIPSRSIQLHEEMPGWYTMLEELAVNLPGCRADWWAEVAYPAFATNERVIYRKEAPKSRAA